MIKYLVPSLKLSHKSLLASHMTPKSSLKQFLKLTNQVHRTRFGKLVFFFKIKNPSTTSNVKLTTTPRLKKWSIRCRICRGDWVSWCSCHCVQVLCGTKVSALAWLSLSEGESPAQVSSYVIRIQRQVLSYFLPFDTYQYNMTNSRKLPKL